MHQAVVLCVACLGSKVTDGSVVTCPQKAPIATDLCASFGPRSAHRKGVSLTWFRLIPIDQSIDWLVDLTPVPART